MASATVHRILAGLGLLLMGCGIAWSTPVIRGEKLVTGRLYEIDLMGEPWKRLMRFTGWGASEVGISWMDDVFYFRCPEQQTISIARVHYEIRPRKDRRLLSFSSPVDWFDHASHYFFEDYYQAIGVDATTPSEFPIRDIKELQAADIAYSVADAPRPCRTPVNSGNPMKARMIIVRLPYRVGLGDPNLLVLLYTSPAETFEQSQGNFERLVDSIRFRPD